MPPQPLLPPTLKCQNSESDISPQLSVVNRSIFNGKFLSCATPLNRSHGDGASTRQQYSHRSNIHSLGLSIGLYEIRFSARHSIASVVTIVKRITSAVRWKKMFVLLATWAIAEVMLNCVGLDDLADYGEFVFDRHRAGPHQLI